jgi:hypothetical protein
MKIKNLIFVMVISLALMITGCWKSVEDEINNDNNNNNNQQNETNVPTEDYPGFDPVGIPRYPNSVRTYHVNKAFSFYTAKATIEDVIAFYENFAEETELEFEYEYLPGEEQEHWLHIGEPGFSGGYGVTLDNDEKPGYVGWILYAQDWPEE